MATKTSRQFDHLVIVGAPTSAAAPGEGVDRAPTALRQAGLLDRLGGAGYRITDAGDLPAEVFRPDPENPRAKNLPRVLAVLEALRPRIEQAVKSHGIPVVLGGDATAVIALAAALRRQASALGLVYLGAHPRFHTPAATDDGLVEPMVVSVLVGQGPAELVRYWNEPPLVREPDLALFGLAAGDPAELDRLERSAIRRYTRAAIRQKGARLAAEAALESVRAATREFVLHVELDAAAFEPPAGSDSSAALGVTEFAEALSCFLAPAKLAGVSLSGFNPGLDPDGRAAARVVELVASCLAARLAAAKAAVEPAAPAPEAGAAAAPEAAAAPAASLPEPAALAGDSEPPAPEAAATPAASLPEPAVPAGDSEPPAPVASGERASSRAEPRSEPAPAAESSEAS